ncbi:GntR family transcriptional regulator [Peterkaempfera bronchialis]|uniref:GntR family transcriptional regulator n=1 Tax=Peterkaempfera bronchialis TaxID=2126346 RepID=UPI003C2E4DD5
MGAGTENAVAKAVAALHEMIASMEILPGQSLRQEALAERLGVSRAPVREALRILESEGLLEHTRHVGYAVKRLTVAEFEQTYLMRRVLEAEVLRALPVPMPEEVLARLERLNEEIVEAWTAGDVAVMRTLNIDFHFTLFRASGLDLVVDEIRRIWALSDVYRSASLMDPRGRPRMFEEHAEMIAALRRDDPEAVVALMGIHRDGTRTSIAGLLAVGSGGSRTA